MVLPRSAMFREAARVSVHASRIASRPQLVQHLGRRAYASAGHEVKKAGGDLPWLIGSVVVTVPVCAYLLQSSPNKGHGHETHGEEHGEDHVEHNEEGDEKAQEEGEDEEGEANDEKSDESDSDDNDAEAQDTPNTSDDESSGGEGGDASKEVRFKGPTQGGPPPDDRLSVPDAKGGVKRRINSAYGQRQGVDVAKDTVSEGSGKDKPAASKEPLSRNHQSGKQEGLSNTDTKHSTPIDKDTTKSHKGEGGPETAKVKGTVDPGRSHPEQRNFSGEKADD